jgi:biotin carboxyl carrier protein
MAPLDFALVRHALNLAKKTGMDEVDLELGESKFHAVFDEKTKKPVEQAPKQTAAQKAEEAISNQKVIKSHNVGIFRDKGDIMKIGAEVAVGDVIGAIVALGISNDVISTVQGKIAEVNVLDSEPVEYGQVLAVVEPS